MKNLGLHTAAAFVALLPASSAAWASLMPAGGPNNFSTIAENITMSISDLPSLLSGVSYLFGILLGALGIVKIKDHVENPQQTALKDGSIRLLAGGGLLALPAVYEAMFTTIGEGGLTTAATLAPVTFGGGI